MCLVPDHRSVFGCGQLRAYLTEIKDSQAALPRKVQADDIWLQKRDLDRFLGLESWDFGSEGGKADTQHYITSRVRPFAGILSLQSDVVAFI